MLEKLFFPGDTEALHTAFLKPNDASPKKLAQIRLGCFIWMLIQLTATNLVGANSLYYTFTNWSVTSNCLCYLIMICAHLINDDFFKESYDSVEAFQAGAKKRPYNFWTAAQGFYEFSFTMSISVTFLYGGILYAYMSNNGYFLTGPWIFDPAGWALHMVPQLFQMVEWRYNSIPL